MSAPLPAPAPSAPDDDAPDAATRFELDGLVYALDRPPRRHARRSVATVRPAERAGDPGFTDRVDLYAYKSRRAFAARVAEAFGRETGDVLGHLAVILDTAERARAEAEVSEPRPEELTPERRAAAEELLAAPDLLERSAAAMEAAGHVGEPEVKRLVYLVATSRLLAAPLSGLLLAPSGAGKSAVLSALTTLLPPEATVPLARLTPMSLYYMGRDALRHKLVVVDEYEGAGEADHPLRVLQSEGELRLQVTVKGRAEGFWVRGPVAVLSGSTATDLDVQNTSRCLELALDDSAEQTRRIQEAQARAWSGEDAHGSLEPQPWRDAQRLLQPVDVAIPFAQRLRFPARATTDRRSSAQLLELVAASALLHQRQRPRDPHGRVLAEPADYRLVYDLLRPTLEDALPDLPPRAARAHHVLAEAGAPLARRDVARALGWTYMTAVRALDDLRAHELVRVVAAGPPRRYRLVEAGALAGSPAGLVRPEELARGG